MNYDLPVIIRDKNNKLFRLGETDDHAFYKTLLLSKYISTDSQRAIEDYIETYPSELDSFFAPTDYGLVYIDFFNYKIYTLAEQYSLSPEKILLDSLCKYTDLFHSDIIVEHFIKKDTTKLLNFKDFLEVSNDFDLDNPENKSFIINKTYENQLLDKAYNRNIKSFDIKIFENYDVFSIYNFFEALLELKCSFKKEELSLWINYIKEINYDQKIDNDKIKEIINSIKSS